MIDLTRAKDIFAQHKIDLSDEQLGQLDHYAELLVEWNQKMNLTTITDPQGILIKHFLDSTERLAYRCGHRRRVPGDSAFDLAAGFTDYPAGLSEKAAVLFGGCAVRMRSYGKNHPQPRRGRRQTAGAAGAV